MGGIRALAAIGPRDAASPAYAQAADWVGGQLRAAGYRVREQAFDLPAGVSWGVRVPAGRPVNVIADPPGFDPAKPHVVIGAHLDTVPQSPGAEDNASGITTMIELARMVRQQPAALPVRFVAFGAEESRGGTGKYAFGSRHFVSSLEAAERRAVRGMVALDRVGVRSDTVPVCSGGRGTASLATAIRAEPRGGGRGDQRVHQQGQRPRLLRGGRHTGGAHRQRAVCRVPLRSRRAVGRRSPPARAGRGGLWAWLRSLR